MLVLDDPITIGPLTLFRDHASATTFHYLPGPPQIVKENGVSRVQLMRFRGSSQGGGLLSLDVHLAHDAAFLRNAAEELSRRFGSDPNLVPVLFDQGAVRLALLNFQQTPAADGSLNNMFVEKTLGTSTPSLLGQQRAIFSARLSPEGSTLLEGALTSGSTPVLIVYELQFSGLRPARGVRARIQYRMAYEYLRARFAANTLYFKTDLDQEAEALARKGLIQIEDIDYQGVDAAVLAKRAEEIRRTLSELMEGLFFRPGASPASLATQEGIAVPSGDVYWATKGRPQAAFIRQELRQDEQDVITYDLSETRVATRRIAPQGAIRPPSGDTAKLILDVTTDWPPLLSTIRVFALPEANWAGVAAIEVDLRHGTEIRTLILSPEKPDLTANFAAGPIEYTWRVIAAADPEALGDPPSSDRAFRPLLIENLVIDPLQLGGRRTVRIALGAIDFSTVSKVSGRLQLNERKRSFMLDASHPECTVPVWGNDILQVQADLSLTSGETIPVERTILPTEPVVLINQPAGRFHVVEVMLQDPLDRYESIHVTLEAAAGARRQNFVLDASMPVAHWSSPRDAEAPRSFRYKMRKVLRNATVVEQDWHEETGSFLVAGDEDVRIENVQGVLLGAQKSQGALIRLTSAHPPANVDPTLEIVLDAAQFAFTARLPFQRTAARKYSVAGQVFLESGAVDLAPREESSEVLLIPVPEDR